MAGALLSAGLAVFAAICAMMAGHNANEAMLLQIQSSDQWNFFQAKDIKANLAELQLNLLQREGKQDLVLSSELSEKISTYKQEQEQIKIQAESKQKESAVLLHRHESLTMAVIFFQVAIALTAIAALVKKGNLMYFSGLLGLIGLGYFAYGLLHT